MKILFFDGDCVLCNGTVHWIIQQDRKKLITFEKLQSQQAERFLNSEIRKSLNTVVFVSEAQQYLKSDAIIEVLLTLGGRWAFLGKLIGMFPRSFRDWVYDIVAKYRL